MDVKSAIESGDVVALRELLAEDATRADAPVAWDLNQRNLTHPLHYVSDMIFTRTLPEDRALPLIGALIEAGANVDFQRDGKGDTPLIGAASLGAEKVGLCLVEAGANREIRGLFGETALHWAAMLGEFELARALTDEVAIAVTDSRYGSTPIGWAIHGWGDQTAENHRRQAEIILLLLAAGATVDPEWLNDAKVIANPAVLAAFRAGVNSVCADVSAH